MLNILLISPYQLMIESLESLFQKKLDLKLYSQLISHASSYQELDIDIHLIILDTQHLHFNGISICEQLKKHNPELKTLVLTDKFDIGHARKLLSTGINGYLLKNNPSANLFTAISEINKEGEYFDDSLKNWLVKSHQTKKTKQRTTILTAREKEVVKHIADGYNVNEIAEKMIISKSTIESHRKNIYLKLGLNKTALLVRYAIDHGIIQ